MDDAQIKHMVSRFLAWRLPETFGPDGGIRFTRPDQPHIPWPVGTNVLNATEAEAMVRHMLEGMPGGTLEDLLRMQVEFPNGKSGAPDFRIAVQETGDQGVRVIIHPIGHNGQTLDRWVKGDAVTPVKWPPAQEQPRKLRDR